MSSREVVNLNNIKRLPLKDQKQWNVQSEKSRLSEYHKWRMAIRIGHVQDIDQIEYTEIDGEIIPLALIELTKAEDTILYPDAYLKKIDESRKRQMDVVRKTGQLLGIPAIYFVYEDEFKKVFIKNLTKHNTWKKLASIDEWKSLLNKLHEEKVNDYQCTR